MRAMSLLIHLGLAILACTGPAAVAMAQLPATRLATIFPPGGKVGAEFQVDITGGHLDDVNRLHFSHEKISAKPRMNGAAAVPNSFIVTIDPTVEPGRYEARAIGRFGISNARAFIVGQRAEAVEDGKNTTQATAMEVALETVINGQAPARGYDWYRFKAAKGQRIIIDCWAERIDSRMDVTLALFDEKGRELERNRDDARRDAVLDLTAPADGVYHLQVYDFLYRGGAEYFYRVSISAGPHVDAIHPPVGVPGSRGKYTLLGRNLPGGTDAGVKTRDGKPLQKLEVEISLPGDTFTRQQLTAPGLLLPRDSAQDGLAYYHRFSEGPGGTANGVFISFAQGPVVREVEPNDEESKAQKVSLPAEIAGGFHPQGDRDWYEFEAKKGQAMMIEVYSERLGLGTDPALVIHRVKPDGKGGVVTSELMQMDDLQQNIGGRKYNTGTRDAGGRFVAPEDGSYRLMLRDNFGRNASSATHLYRLSLREEKGDFRLVALPRGYKPGDPKATEKQERERSLLLRKGGSTAVDVMAFRIDGHGGPIEVYCEGLPDGVACQTTVILPGQTVSTLVFTAREDAKPWAGNIRIMGKGRVGDKELLTEARGGTLLWDVGDSGAELIQSRMTGDLALAVSEKEASPLSIEVGGPEGLVTAVTGSTVKVPVKIVRRNGMAAKLTLAPIGGGGAAKIPPLTLEPAASGGELVIDTAKLGLGVGEHRFYLRTEGPVDYRNYLEEVDPANSAKTAAEKAAADLAPQAAKAEAMLKEAQTKATAAAEALKKAAEQLAAAEKAAVDAMAADLEAQKKMDEAGAALSKMAEDKTLLDARTAAEKNKNDMGAKLKAAQEAAAAAKAARDKTMMEDQAAQAAKAQAAASHAMLVAQAAAAEEAKKAAAERVKELAVRSKPQKLQEEFFSGLILLKVTAPPPPPPKPATPPAPPAPEKPAAPPAAPAPATPAPAKPMPK